MKQTLFVYIPCPLHCNTKLLAPPTSQGSTAVSLWTTDEVHTAVISACLPTLRPLVQYSLSVSRSLSSTIKSYEISGHAGTSSDESYMLSQKERDVFQLLPESKDGHRGAREPAKSKFVSAMVMQVGPERGDRF